MELTTGMIIGIVVVALLILAAIFIAISYVKAPPNMIYIISGLGKLKQLRGEGGIRIPFFQQVDILNLELMNIDVNSTDRVPTKDFISITVDAVVTAKISSDPKMVEKAAQNFLNAKVETIKGKIVNILEGNIREIVGQTLLTDLVNDRKGISDSVMQNAVPDLEKLGIEIKTFNIQNFKDDQGLIISLGADKEASIRQAAAISKANSEKNIAKAQAEAKKLANDAKVAAELEIAQKNTELEVKKSELKIQQDKKKADADAAYDIQHEIQQKQINITAAEAETARQEKLIDVRAKEVEVKEKELEAEFVKTAEAKKKAAIIAAEGNKQTAIITAEGNKQARLIDAETAKQAKIIEADADYYETEKNAQALKVQQQNDADAKRYTQEQNAEADKISVQKNAEAEKFKKEQEAEAAKTQTQLAAEANKFEQEQKAEADKTRIEKNAEANKFQQEQMAEGIKAIADANLEAAKAEAQGTEAKGKAEGEAIKAKGNAEAEALLKKAESLAKMNETGRLDMQLEVTKLYVEKLPEVAGAVGKAFASVGKIEMYGTGNETQLAKGVTDIINQVSAGLGSTFGGDGKSILSSFLGAKAAMIGKEVKDKDK